MAQELNLSEVYGVKSSETLKFQTVLNHSWTAGAKLEVVPSKEIPSLSASYSETLGITTTNVAEYSTETEIRKANDRKITFDSNQLIRLVERSRYRGED